MRFLSTRLHGVLDYLVGLLLIAAPFVFHFGRGGPEQWVPVGLGAAVIVYSLLTDYELGVVRKIGMPAHLWLDALGGAFLAASPWIFGFDQQVCRPHLIVGLLEIVVAFFSNTIPSYERRRAR
jgi:hypothetical protein